MTTQRGDPTTDAPTMLDPRLLRLAPQDNVAVLKRPLAAGTEIVKLGVAIGVATADIPVWSPCSATGRRNASRAWPTSCCRADSARR